MEVCRYYQLTETGFYYLQSRYYDPTLGRFINADSYASTGQGFLGYNMFAYCNNVPNKASDPTGHEMEWIRDEYGSVGVPQTDGSSAIAIPFGYGIYTGDVGGGTSMTVATTPTYSSVVARAVATVGTAAVIGSCLSPAANPNEDNEDENNKPIYIFRHHGTNPSNLVPRSTDAALSFQLTPERNSWVTTLEVLNNSGMFLAEIDGPNHVSVYPVGIDTYTWSSQGVRSPWTQYLIELCIKYK